MSTGIDPIDSAPLIIRTYNDDSADNTFLLTRYDYPVSSNYVLRTSANGSLAPSDALTQTTMGMSSMTISNHFGSTMVYDTFSSGTLFLPLGIYDTIVKTTMMASSVTASTIFLNVLNICTMNASTFSPNGVTVAYTTLGSTVQTSSMTYSTLIGDSISGNTGFVTTLFGSSIYATSTFASAMASDTSRLSTLVMDSTIVGFLSFSTLQGNTLVVNTLSGSSIYTNPLTVSTLDGGLLVTSTISCTTLSVSSLYASGLVFSTTIGSSMVMSTMTAPLLFSHSLSFSTAQGSTVTVSSATVSSLYASLLVGSTLQTNTLVFSTLTASSVNTSELIYSTAQGSTMLVSTIGVSTLSVGALSSSTLSGSSMMTNMILLSTLSGSTISWNRVALSTLQGSNAMVSSVTVSTLFSGAVVAAFLQGSTVLVSTVTGNLNTNFLSGSTILSDSLFFSTLSVSTLVNNSAVYSTLQGSTTTLSTLTVSTLSVSTMMASTLNGSSVVCSTITTSSIQSDGIVFSTLHGSTLLLSTLTSCTINAQTISVSTLQGSTVTVSTLTGSTIVSGQLAYSTLIGSTIVTDYINATSTCTGNGTLLLSTLAFSTQQTSAAFLSTLIVTSTLTVSTLNRINPTSFTASTLTLSGGLQANTATGLLVCSSLTVNAMNLSRSIVNQPVYGNAVKTDSIVAPGQSLVRTSGIRATIDQMPNQTQTYTFGAAIPNRWVAVGGTASTIAYSNDGFNWTSVGGTVLGTGRCAVWNGSIWVAVADIGSSNSISYSYDGIRWTGCGTGIFTSYGLGVAWNGSMWVGVGGGTNSIAYSYDGINWSGLGTSIFSTYGHTVVWNGTLWVAVGTGTNTIAYSYDGIIWTGAGTSIIASFGLGLAWSGTMWVAGGTGGNSLAYSYDGINWTGLGNIFPTIYTVAWNGTIWVAGSDSVSHSLLYSYDGMTWIGLGTSIFSHVRAISWNGNMFIAGGGGTNTLAYSYNGINWTGLGTVGLPNLTMGCGFNSTRPHRITFPTPMTVATGSGTNTLAYSTNGITWTGNGLGIFSTQGNGVATNGSMWVATGSGTNTLAYSTADIETPYIHLPFENGLYADVMGNSTVTAYGSPAFVTGTIGSKAVNLANTAASTAVKYIRGTWTGASNVTVSGWFNPQTLNSTYQIIFSAYSTFFTVLINPSNQLTALVPSGGGSNYVNVGSSYALTVNTWYYFSLIFQTNGVCSLYLNNALLGGITNSQGVGSLTTSVFELSGYDSNQAFAFNGYIDDFRLYNYAVTVNQRITWRGLGTSIFSTQGNGVAWNGTMWVAVGSGTNSIAYSYDGVTWIGLGLLVLTQGNAVAWSGSMWVAVGSGANSIAYSYDGITWAGSSFYNTQWNGVAWNGSMWIAVGSGPNIMACSYDGINWNIISSTISPPAYLPFDNSPLDVYSKLTLPTIVGTITYSNSIRIVGNYSAYFANTAGNSIADNYLDYLTPLSLQNPTAFTISFWMYPTAYSIYAVSIPIGFNDGNGTRGLFFYATPYGINAAFATTTALTSTGVYYTNSNTLFNWWHVAFTFSIVSGSGVATLYINGVAQSSATVSGTGGLSLQDTGGPMTHLTIGCQGAVTGAFAYTGYIDDVRIYTSALTAPFILSMYNLPSTLSYIGNNPILFTTSGNGVAWNGNQWVAVGSGGNTILYSSNGLTWTAAASSCFTTAGNGVTWNGTRWVATGTGTIGIGYSSDGSTWTGGIVQNINNTISPQLTGLVTYTWIQNGVAWATSSSSVYSTLYAYGAFNTVNSPVGTYSWASNVSTYSTISPFACASGVSTTIQGIGAVVGEWLQLQSSTPLIMRSYTYGCGGFPNIPQKYYIVGSNDGSTWYPIQYASMTTNPLIANFTVCSTSIIVNQSGPQTIIGGQTGSGIFTTYATTTNAYSYFRILATNVFGGGSLFELGEWYINFGSPFVFNIYDPSRYYYHYTLYNGATVTPSSYKPYTPSITLASASSQYIQTANFTPTTAGLSFAFWYKSNASGSWARVFDFGNGPANNVILCSINGGNANYLYFEDFYGSVATNISLTDINYNDNTWRHVVWTLSYAAAGSNTSTWNIYINGALKTTGTSKSYPNPAVTRTISYIGRSNWSADAYYNGNIDDFRIYNAVLTAPQVTTIYSGSVYDSTYNTTFSTAGSKIASNNTLSGTVMIQHPVVAVGQGTHSLAYSPDGVQWTGLGTALFSTGYAVAWNGSKWIVGGLGTNTLAYSYDGIRWTGLGSTVFSTQANGIAWNGSIWVAVGSGTNSVAYSTDGLAWTNSVQGNAIFTSCNAVAWNGKQWVAVGLGAKSIAYSADGITWTAMSSTDVFTQGNGICWTGSLWIAVGAGINTIAYSLDGMSWTGLGNTIFSTSGNGICWNGTRWIAVGTGSAHTIAYSANGTTWTGFGKTIFSTAGNGVCWTGLRFVAVGNGATIGYSQDGIMWYSAPNSIFTQGNGVAGNPRLGAAVSDSQVALSDSLDVVSDAYYNTGYTNFSVTIQSHTYVTDKSNIAIVIKTLPGAPTNVMGVLYPSGAAISIRVSFTYPVNTGGGIDAYYASAIDITGVQPTVIASSPSQPITIIGLVPGTTYRFEVYSSNSAGQSAPTASASNLFFQVVPSAPQNYSVVLNPPSNPTEIVVSFTAPATSGGITNYTVTANGGSAQTGTALSYTFTGLTPGTLYTFSAYGTNTGGAGAVASSSITYYTKPDAPTVSSITLDPPSAPTGVNVAFTAPTNTGGGALTYVATAYSGATAIASSVSGAASPLYVTGLTAGTSYTYRIVASNAAVPAIVSDASAASAATTYYSQPVAPTSVSGVLAPSAQPTGVSVSFTAPSNTIANTGGATLSYIARAYNSSLVLVSSSSSGSSSPLTITGLTAGVSYTYRVVSSNGFVTSAESTASAALIYYTRPDPPTGVSAALHPSTAPTGVNVSFTAPINTGGGILTYVARAYSGVSLIGSGTSSSSTATQYINATNMTPGQSYLFLVEASNSTNSTLLNNSNSVSLIYYTNPSTFPSIVFTYLSQDFFGIVKTYKLEWTAPGSNGGSPIVSYRVTNIVDLGGGSGMFYDSGLLSPTTRSVVNLTLYSSNINNVILTATNGAGYTRTYTATGP